MVERIMRRISKKIGAAPSGWRDRPNGETHLRAET
jgi:hypothetical protein